MSNSDKDNKNIADHSDSSVDNKNQNAKRRKVVKTILASGGAVTAASTMDKWGKSVVSSVVLPVHAQTSDTAPMSGGDFSVSNAQIVSVFDDLRDDLIADESISEELLEFFLPSAHAQSEHCFFNCSVDINATFTDTTAYFCLDGSTTGMQSGTATVDTSTNPPSCGSSVLGPITVESGEFISDQWVLSVSAPNVSTSVTLTRGGSGCAIMS